MCGFILIYDKKIDTKKARLSLDKMIHRGPDEQKSYIDENIFMGFNRLAIQDLTKNASQPMAENINNSDFYLMFNGEIYNFLNLKKNVTKIKNLKFKSKSDTEVISKLYANYSMEKVLDMIQGMFAICIYNKKEKKIYLTRDIFGQKPLYYYSYDNKFIASSEIKGIVNYIEKVEPEFFGLLNPVLQTGNSPSNYTMFKNINKVLPGEILEFNLENCSYKIKKHLKLNSLVDEKEYIRLENLSYKKLIEQFSETLMESVKMHGISDVKIAAAASLGLDSSVIVDLMKKNYGDQINCISYISQEDEDIANNKDVIKYFSDTIHHKFSENNKNFIENLIYSTYYCESVGREDNMVLSEVSKISKNKNIKVLLTGDGSDELFGSLDYQQKIYFNSIGYYNKLIRRTNLILKNYFPLISNLFVYHSPRNDGYFIYPNNLASLELSSDLMLYNGDRKKNFYDALNSYYFIKNESERNYQSIILDDLNTRFQRFLSRSDSYGMQNSVEVRLPYLDINFVKLCLNTPIKQKAKLQFFNIKKKNILKEIAKNLKIPKKIINRSKVGTDFYNKESYMNLIKNEKFFYLSSIFKIDSTKLKSLLLSNNFRYYSREHFSFLSAEALFKMFIDKKDPKELHEEYKDKI